MQQPMSTLYCSNQAKLGCCGSTGGCSTFQDNLWFWFGLVAVMLMPKKV